MAAARCRRRQRLLGALADGLEERRYLSRWPLTRAARAGRLLRRAAHVGLGFTLERGPRAPGRRDDQPLLHDAAGARLEARALAGVDERIDARLRQLDHERAAHIERIELAVDLAAVVAERHQPRLAFGRAPAFGRTPGFGRFSTRTTRRSPLHVSSMAQTLLSTSPVGSATSRTAFSVMSVATPDAFLGHAIHSPPAGCRRAATLASRPANLARAVTNQTTTSTSLA